MNRRHRIKPQHFALFILVPAGAFVFGILATGWFMENYVGVGRGSNWRILTDPLGGALLYAVVRAVLKKRYPEEYGSEKKP